MYIWSAVSESRWVILILNAAFAKSWWLTVILTYSLRYQTRIENTVISNFSPRWLTEHIYHDTKGTDKNRPVFLFFFRATKKKLHVCTWNFTLKNSLFSSLPWKQTDYSKSKKKKTDGFLSFWLMKPNKHKKNLNFIPPRKWEKQSNSPKEQHSDEGDDDDVWVCERIMREREALWRRKRQMSLIRSSQLTGFRYTQRDTLVCVETALLCCECVTHTHHTHIKHFIYLSPTFILQNLMLI